jgi:hypothetical protein
MKDPAESEDFIRSQLNRPAWYDEIDFACLNAFEIMGDERLVPAIVKFTTVENPGHIQTAALAAWKSCAPKDPRLHKVLMERAEYGEYNLKWHSVQSLRSLLVEEAIPILERISRESGDNDLRVIAEHASSEIKRVVETQK